MSVQSEQRDRRVEITALPGLPHFAAGDDLADAIADALRRADLTLGDGDVLVVAQKVVSKVEGRTVVLADIAPSPAALALAAQTAKPESLAQLILDESQEIMRAKRGVVIARHRLGHVAANAGIDASNVADQRGEAVLLWPTDPDASATRLRRRLEARFGVRIAVLISDSLGRAWRMGTIGTAIGASGIGALIDRRGETDLFGRVLQSTLVARADELAAAASLVIGEAAEATPVALIRGASYNADETQGIGPILRPLSEDMFT